MAINFDVGSLIGGAISSAGSAKAVKRQIAWERERAQNAHQWEVQDLQKAGLNPILSAGGQGAVTGSIDATNTYEGYAQGINNAINNTIALKDLKMREKKNNAEIDNINANTAQTLAMTPELIKTHQWNRQPHAVRELGGTAIIVSEIIDEIAKKTRKWFKQPHSAEAKKYVEKHPNEFPHLKTNKRTD